MTSSNEQVLIRDGERWFELVRTSSGLILRVVRGGVAMYEVAIRLNEEEEARFTAEGESFIRDLAYRVARDGDAFADREIRG